MITNAVITRKAAKRTAIGEQQRKPRITLFHCVNSIGNPALSANGDCEVQSVKMPCSSMTREVFLLRAFEAGADAVVVMVCPEGSCRYLEGNIRAGKRVARVKKLLDEIGLDGRRLNLCHVAPGDQLAVDSVIGQTVSELDTLGPNPAAWSSIKWSRP